MAFYSILSKKRCISGTYCLTKPLSEELYTYNKMITFPYQYVSPVTLSYITVDSSNKNAFRYLVYASDTLLYHTFSREELTQITVDYVSSYQHGNYEFSYILDGTCNYIIDGQRQTFTPNSCYFQSPYIVKCEDFSTDHSILTLLFSPEYMKEICPDVSRHKDYSFFHILPEFQKSYFKPSIKSILDEIVMLFLHSDIPGFSSLLKGYLAKLFYTLGTDEWYSKDSMHREGHSFLFEQIISLLKESDGRIRRKDLEERLNYSGDYLNTLVKKYTNMTLTEFSNTYALQKVSWLLLNSDMTIDEICETLHFTDRTYFFKIFKEKYGMTPLKYRTLFRF